MPTKPSPLSRLRRTRTENAADSTADNTVTSAIPTASERAASDGSAPAERLDTEVLSVWAREAGAPLSGPQTVVGPARAGAPTSGGSDEFIAHSQPPAPTTVGGQEVRRALFGDVEPAEIVADSITAWFGTRKVLDRVSLTMKKGEVTALIGPSGCGKSTFLRILNRMHELVPSAALAGEVRLDGSNIYAADQRITAARRSIGMIFQKPNPFPAMSIYDNVVSGLKLSGIASTREIRDVLVEDSLRKASLWDEVKDRLDQPGGGLSGGQQQRLCIARSLAVSPRVLLMDEPCSALDPTSTRRVEETIEQLKGSTTVVIVTHNMQQANRVSDDCAFFLAAQNTPGVIVEHGATEAMFDRPRDQRTSDYVNGRFG
jgi:phosphate transport system ATP-binding protein